MSLPNLPTEFPNPARCRLTCQPITYAFHGGLFEVSGEAPLACHGESGRVHLSAETATLQESCVPRWVLLPIAAVCAERKGVLGA